MALHTFAKENVTVEVLYCNEVKSSAFATESAQAPKTNVQPEGTPPKNAIYETNTVDFVTFTPNATKVIVISESPYGCQIPHYDVSGIRLETQPETRPFSAPVSESLGSVERSTYPI
jgi:hypothetical protein